MPSSCGEIHKGAVAPVPIVGVDAEVVADDEILPTVTVEVGMADGLGPAGVGDTAARRHVLESEPSSISEQPIRQCVFIVPGQGREHSARIVAEHPDIDIEESVAVIVERGRRSRHQPIATETRCLRHVLEPTATQVAVEPDGIVHIGDQDVRQTVVVEVAQDGLPRFPRKTVLVPHPLKTRPRGWHRGTDRCRR